MSTIEAFGCGLPERYVAAMAQRSVAPTWFVLEYLSAEAWVDRSHGLASPHPRIPLHAALLVSRDSRRGPAGCCASAGSSMRATRFVNDSGAQSALLGAL